MSENGFGCWHLLLLILISLGTGYTIAGFYHENGGPKDCDKGYVGTWFDDEVDQCFLDEYASSNFDSLNSSAREYHIAATRSKCTANGHGKHSLDCVRESDIQKLMTYGACFKPTSHFSPNGTLSHVSITELTDGNGNLICSVRYWLIHSITIPSLFVSGWLFIS